MASWPSHQVKLSNSCWCFLKNNLTQKDYNFAGISSLALCHYFRGIHQNKFRSWVTMLLRSSLRSWMRIAVAGDHNGDKKNGEKHLKTIMSVKKCHQYWQKVKKDGWILQIITMLVMVPSYYIFIKYLSLLLWLQIDKRGRERSICWLARVSKLWQGSLPGN